MFLFTTIWKLIVDIIRILYYVLHVYIELFAIYTEQVIFFNEVILWKDDTIVPTQVRWNIPRSVNLYWKNVMLQCYNIV